MRLIKSFITSLLALSLICSFPIPVFAQTTDGPVLFSDDFSDGNLDGWNIETGNWFVDQNKTLTGQGIGRMMPGRVGNGTLWTDYRLEFDVLNDFGVDVGIGFRRKDDANGYELTLRFGAVSPQVVVSRLNQGAVTPIFQNTSFPLSSGQIYHVKLEVVGDKIKGYINDKLAFDLQDTGTTILDGPIQLAYWSGATNGIQVHFDNIKVTSLVQNNGPKPFLRLPWDYQSKGLSFNEAALAINSYFDHEYPLLSTSLQEPTQTKGSVIFFGGGERNQDRDYSTHDGYDYGTPAKANLGNPVLAAADGTAEYVNTCAPCGNAVFIDHGNGFQTRYYHLLKDGLITHVPGQKVAVKQGQPVGKLGFTGNVSPPNDAGAHIHFMVVEDKNRDGNFEDNIPDGLIDPFGWQSKDPDPWENYSFFYLGKNRTGNKSFYLWQEKLDNLDSTLTANGGVFKTERFSFNFPENSANQNLNINLQPAPTVKASDSLESIGSTIVAIAKDASGNFIKQFQDLYTLTVDFKNLDLAKFKTDSISIYSSEDGINWIKEVTSVDLTNKSASTKINHFSYFALMAQRLDTTPPATTANLSGDQGRDKWFRSDVKLPLDVWDSGSGNDYTVYRISGKDWEKYETPLLFSDEGHYKVEFYSVDKDANIENLKSVEFDIDKTLPEAKISIDQTQPDLVVTGTDQNLEKVEKQENTATKRKDDAIYLISDLAGNTFKMDVRDWDKTKKDKFRIFNIQYNSNPAQEEPDNHFNADYQMKKDQAFFAKEQNFSIKGEVKIRIRFNQEKNQSTIVTREGNDEKTKETKDGLILLQLITNKGNLDYSY